jgi:hypothetical protein
MSTKTTQAMMVQSTITQERVDAVQAATEKMLAALDAEQPEGMRYASCLLPDGETFIALLQLDEGVENPLPGFPEYGELLGIVEGSRAAPPSVQQLTVIGSYRLF